MIVGRNGLYLYNGESSYVVECLGDDFGIWEHFLKFNKYGLHWNTAGWNGLEGGPKHIILSAASELRYLRLVCLRFFSICFVVFNSYF
jgi:hypothetical protein